MLRFESFSGGLNQKAQSAGSIDEGQGCPWTVIYHCQTKSSNSALKDSPPILIAQKVFLSRTLFLVGFAQKPLCCTHHICEAEGHVQGLTPLPRTRATSNDNIYISLICVHISYMNNGRHLNRDNPFVPLEQSYTHGRPLTYYNIIEVESLSEFFGLQV